MTLTVSVIVDISSFVVSLFAVAMGAPDTPQPPPPPQRIDLAQCQLIDCIVYKDRAELTRTVNVEIPQQGPQDIVVFGLSASVQENSIHVAGTGDAVILEAITKHCDDD